MPLEASDIAKLTATTRALQFKGRLTQLATSYQNFTAMNRLMKLHKVGLKGGKELEFYLMTSFTNTAENSSLYDTDDVVVAGSSTTSATVPWRWSKAHCAWDLREPALNSDSDVKLMDFAKLQEMEMNLSRALLHERNLWGKPASSTDKVTPYGVDYWVTFPSSYSVDGFYGGNPSGFTAGCAGVDSDTYTRWRNWYGQFSAVSQDDLVERMIQAEHATRFESLIPDAIPDLSKGDQLGIYTNWDIISALRYLYRDQNDDLGTDIAIGVPGSASTPSFHGRPFEHVSFLDEGHSEGSSAMAARDPVYMINWGVFEFTFLSGWDGKRTTEQSPTSHNVVVVWSDDGYNTACYDRRRQALIAKSA